MSKKKKVSLSNKGFFPVYICTECNEMFTEKDFDTSDCSSDAASFCQRAPGVQTGRGKAQGSNDHQPV